MDGAKINQNFYIDVNEAVIYIKLTHSSFSSSGREPSLFNKSAKNVTLTPVMAGPVDVNFKSYSEQYTTVNRDTKKLDNFYQ